MKKRVLYLLLGISILGSMTGCSTAAKEEAAVSTEESVESILPDSYEKQHREVREPVYRTAATSFAGGDGSENRPYEISSAEELQYLPDRMQPEFSAIRSIWGMTGRYRWKTVKIPQTSSPGSMPGESCVLPYTIRVKKATPIPHLISGTVKTAETFPYSRRTDISEGFLAWMAL